MVRVLSLFWRSPVLRLFHNTCAVLFSCMKGGFWSDNMKFSKYTRFVMRTSDRLNAVRQSEGQTLRQITAALNAQGVPSFTGAPWTPSTVRRAIHRAYELGLTDRLNSDRKTQAKRRYQREQRFRRNAIGL